MKIYYTRFDTPLCKVILAGDDDGLIHLHLQTGEGSRKFDVDEKWIRNDAYFSETIAHILDYMAGEKELLEIKINPQGTDFQKKVWSALRGIPCGETRTYKEIANLIGNDKASRAVGMANSKNPIPLIIPCHRVIGANGQLTGFAHGLSIKEKLIKMERDNLHGPESILRCP